MNDKNEMSEKLREEHNEIVKQGRLELVIECPECHKHDVLILDHRIVEKTSVCASCGSDFIVPMFSQVHADAFAAKAVKDREMEIAGELANAIGSAAKGDGGIAIAQLHRKLEGK